MLCLIEKQYELYWSLKSCLCTCFLLSLRLSFLVGKAEIIMFSLSTIMDALGCNKGIAYYKKQFAVLDACNASLLLITAELLISHHCFERMSSNWGLSAEEVFGPRKENNSLKGPCWIIWLQRKQNRTLGPALMLQAGCIYMGVITPCPETFHPLYCPEDLSPLAQLQMPSQLKNTQNIPPD